MNLTEGKWLRVAKATMKKIKIEDVIALTCLVGMVIAIVLLTRILFYLDFLESKMQQMELVCEFKEAV